MRQPVISGNGSEKSNLSQTFNTTVYRVDCAGQTAPIGLIINFVKLFLSNSFKFLNFKRKSCVVHGV